MIGEGSCATRVPVPEVRKKMVFVNIIATVGKKTPDGVFCEFCNQGAHRKNRCVCSSHNVLRERCCGTLPGGSDGDRTDAKLGAPRLNKKCAG